MSEVPQISNAPSVDSLSLDYSDGATKLILGTLVEYSSTDD